MCGGKRVRLKRKLTWKNVYTWPMHANGTFKYLSFGIWYLTYMLGVEHLLRDSRPWVSWQFEWLDHFRLAHKIEFAAESRTLHLLNSSNETEHNFQMQGEEKTRSSNNATAQTVKRLVTHEQLFCYMFSNDKCNLFVCIGKFAKFFLQDRYTASIPCILSITARLIEKMAKY